MPDLRAVTNDDLADIYLSGFLGGVMSGLVNAGVPDLEAHAKTAEFQRRFLADPAAADKWAREAVALVLDRSHPNGAIYSAGKLTDGGVEQ